MIALDVAVLPPPEVSRRAIELSAALPETESQGLRLGANALPHITLTQQFVRRDDLGHVLERVDAALNGFGPLRLSISGSGSSQHTVWMRVLPAPALVELHRHLMDVLQPFERPGGTEDAFFDADARLRDIVWVTEYRQTSSFAAFTPHLTLGHAAQPPVVDPMDFDATTIAACHLGRFCSCRRVLRRWTLS